jgi:uncharacterized protein YrrD
MSEPVSYLTLEAGTPVVSSDGARIGTVAHVLYDAGEDIFDGIVVETKDGHRFADAPEVASIRADAVTLSIDAQAAARLPQPSANPAALQAGADETAPYDLGDKLRRAWDYISGKY